MPIAARERSAEVQYTYELGGLQTNSSGSYMVRISPQAFAASPFATLWNANAFNPQTPYSTPASQHEGPYNGLDLDAVRLIGLSVLLVPDTSLTNSGGELRLTSRPRADESTGNSSTSINDWPSYALYDAVPLRKTEPTRLGYVSARWETYEFHQSTDSNFRYD